MKTKSQFLGLFFHHCNMQNNLSQKIAKILPFRNIIKVSVYCDAFSNKGLKDFMQLYMPYLIYLSMGKNLITTDCKKLLKKRREGYHYLSIYFQKNFHYLPIVNTLDHFEPLSQKH